TYGKDWVHGSNHPAQFDDLDSLVTWDGTCVNDGPGSYAVLSNGWKPAFKGHGCTIALDYQGGCTSVPKACETRVAYGKAWDGPANHPNPFDDVKGRVFSEGECVNDGDASFVRLSNGWEPHFKGKNACSVSFVYEQCGGLYDNAVHEDCADPGVLRDGDSYFAVCTGGNANGTYVIRSSKDLVHWKNVGHIFPNGKKPAWADGTYWAPEIHKVGQKYVAYFSARHKNSGRLAIGAASGPTPTGPFTDLGKPLVLDGSMSMIDVSYFEDDKGTPYLLWKADGNAQGKPTPIYGQKLSASGLSLVGARTTLISNTLGWEGPLVEAPWVTRHGGKYFLFYSGNAYYNDKYAVGVARSDSPLGPYAKKGAPILTSDNSWVGPGHNSVVVGPDGEDYMVYHAWAAGQVNGNGDSRRL
ncbi:MAG: glycosyl hydrolase, partial [Myxococcales bacterium]